jgi:hypothetical protein
MSTGTTANAYGHPRLAELIQQAASTPFIGQVLIQTVRDLVHPQDRILACYYQLETSGATADKEFTYYSVDAVIVTTAFFIRINFYPKTHTAVKKRIFTISDIKVEYPAPPMEELGELKTSEFLPARVALAATFVNDRGGVVETWTAEASDLIHVRQIMEINRLLGRVVGMPLAQAAGAASAG